MLHYIGFQYNIHVCMLISENALFTQNMVPFSEELLYPGYGAVLCTHI